MYKSINVGVFGHLDGVMDGCFGQRWAGIVVSIANSYFWDNSVLMSRPPPKGMEPEVDECNGREKKEAKLELSSFSVTII